MISDRNIKDRVSLYTPLAEIFVIALCLISCNTHQVKPPVGSHLPDSVATVNKRDSLPGTTIIDSSDTLLVDDTICDLIFHLPEVKELDKRLSTDTALHVAMVVDHPTASYPYYMVRVGTNDPYIFSTIYNFYITPARRHILYLDTQNDTLITLQRWRKTRGW